MTAPFDVLRDRPRIAVTVTRESVCADDDCDAPHERQIEAYSFLYPAAFAQAVSQDYLPLIAGVGHTWTCVLNDVRIAEVGSSGIRPLVRTTPFAEMNHVHFVYHAATY